MAIQNKETLLPASEKGSDAVKTICAVGGFLAAFGVASCCALPIALSPLGISAASLVGIGYLAAQYQQELFYAAAICLGASAFVMVRQRRAQSCAPGTACTRPILDWAARLPWSSRSDCLCSLFGSNPRYECHSSVDADVSEVQCREGRDHADQRVPVLLRMHWLQDVAQAQAWRLLRVLLLWVGALSADPGRQERRLLPRVVSLPARSTSGRPLFRGLRWPDLTPLDHQQQALFLMVGFGPSLYVRIDDPGLLGQVFSARSSRIGRSSRWSC